jgi:hypothetical protein
VEIYVLFKTRAGVLPEQECFIRYKTKERSSSVLYLIKHGLRVFQMAYKNEPSDEFIGEVLLKIKVVKPRKSKLKFMQMNMILLHMKPQTR